MLHLSRFLPILRAWFFAVAVYTVLALLLGLHIYSQKNSLMDEHKSAELKKRLEDLIRLEASLKKVQSLEDKERILNGLIAVKNFSSNKILGSLSLEERLVAKSCIAIGEWRGSKFLENLPYLKLVHDFFRSWEGLIGYQRITLEALLGVKIDPHKHFLAAPGLDIVQDSPELSSAIFEGIISQQLTAEMWPVGGAGDRLGLVDEVSGEPLPAALLDFCGYNLLEGLVRDLFAREWLYFKIHGKQLTTPVGLMTSLEKNNHAHIVGLFEGSSFYGRPKESLQCFMQPLVPVIDMEGHWQYDEKGHVKIKPGGHGVIWKLAFDHHILEWFKDFGRKAFIVRQINNPVAATDYGLLALLGYGIAHHKKIGFLSCERAVGAAEGMNLLIEKEVQGQYEYALSNVEYTEFPRYNLKDSPRSENSPYSIYPSNTNILFASIEAIEEAVQKLPLPGPLLNFKGTPLAARLETMMQNIADVISVVNPTRLEASELEEKLPSYILYGERRKTISVTKNTYVAGKSIKETPLGALYDYFANMQELFRKHCGFLVPPLSPVEEFVDKGAITAIIMHPALGPLWDIIGQKIQKGALHKQAELILDIEAVSIHTLVVKGSLMIQAVKPLGQTNEQGHILFSEKRGRASLQNVTVSNNVLVRPLAEYLKRPLAKRGLSITLEGFSEIDISDTIFEEEEEIIVPHGYRLLIQKGLRTLEPITEPSWQWNYTASNKGVFLNYENRFPQQKALSQNAQRSISH